MGLRSSGSFAKVWKVEPQERFTKVQLSVSKKNQNGEYETDFSGFMRFIGEAHKKASTLKNGDRIKIGDFEVTTSYNAETKVTFTNYAVFTYEMADAVGQTNAPAAPAPAPEPAKKAAAKKAAPKSKPAAFDAEDDDENLPF